MNTIYKLKEVSNTLIKLFDAGYNTEKKILMMKMDDLTNVKNLMRKLFAAAFQAKNLYCPCDKDIVRELSQQPYNCYPAKPC